MTERLQHSKQGHDMFNSSHPNYIVSDEGFSVRVIGGGQLGIDYREGNKAIRVLSEVVMDDNIGYIIYKNSIKEWSPPDSGDFIDETTRKRIINNLRRAFLFQGYQIGVDEDKQIADWALRKLQKID